MKILKFISTLFFGIVLGVALTVGGVALGGYMVWTKEGSIGQVTDLANQYVGELPVNFGDDIKAMSLGTYVTSVISLVTDIGNAEVSEVENFPEGRHDDIVDVLSGAFNELNSGHSILDVL